MVKRAFCSLVLFCNQILEQLEAQRRRHGRHRNLVVAAMGTGKTVIAALDYKRLARQMGGYPSLLFVAHRREILQQTRRTFHTVLRDGSFGELYRGWSTAGTRTTCFRVHTIAGEPRSE
jgi:superfamily II DNA or RNA helicase